MKKRFLCILLFCFTYSHLFSQITVYVDSSANGSNNGTSWTNAYKHLDSALSYAQLATDDVDIRIAKGTFKPTKKAYSNGVQVVTSDNKDKTFHIPYGTSLYGGYPNGGGTRNPVLNPVILSGQLSGTEQAYHVLYQGLGAGTTFIDGITITVGNCTSGFTVYPYGGGYYAEGEADAFFTQVKFIQNNASKGGAVFFYFGYAAFTKCEFESNTASLGIGGVYSDHGDMSFKACVFSNNNNGCFRSNTNGAIDASSTLFIGNTSTQGGALFVGGSDIITLRSCTFYGNESTQTGGAIYTLQPGTLNMYNCIFDSNIGNGISNDVAWSVSPTINARYCSFQNINSSYPSGMFTAAGITSLYFNQNPQFVNSSNPKGTDNVYGTSDDGLKLSNASLCINTGSNTYTDASYLFDLTGASRTQGTSIDRGAYEQDCGSLGCASTSVIICGSYLWPVNGQTYTSSGTYTAQQACTLQTLELTILPSPPISLNGATSICAGGSTTLSVSGGISYVWMPGNLTSSTLNLTPTTSTNYTVTVTTASGCTASSVVNVVVNSLPTVSTSTSASSVCPGSTVTITATPNTNTYVWQPGNFSGNPLTAYPNAATTYTVTGTSVNTGCTKTATRLISMKSVPNITTSATPSVVCSGASSIITANGGVSYVWQPGGNTTTAITVNPIVTSTYTVTGTSATSGCTKSVTRTITVNCGNSFNLKCFIEGYYLGNSIMQPVLNNQGLTNPITQADSLTLELHQATIPFSTVYSIKVVLQTNGTYSEYFPASTSGNSYYIVLKHRNALETWSKDPVLFSSSTSYDFSDEVWKAFGDNMKLLSTGVYGLFSGDVNNDGSIDVFDYLLLEPEITNGSAGYLPLDFNGDGGVDVFDYLLLENNMNIGAGSLAP